MPGGFSKAITFCLPNCTYSSALMDSSLGKHCQLPKTLGSLHGGPLASDGGDGSEHELVLKMIPVTPNKLREWTLCNLEAKHKVKKGLK